MLLEPNCVDNFIDEQLYKKMLDIAIDELVEIAEDSEIYLVDNMRICTTREEVFNVLLKRAKKDI